MDKNEAVLAVFEQVHTENVTSSQNTTSTATLLDLENHFPTFFGNFSDQAFICPSLPLPILPTFLNVKDTGYLYTILHHYNTTGAALGTNITLLNWSDFEELRGTYSIRLTMIEGTLSCTYVSAEDKKMLAARVSDLQNAQSSPSPGNGNETKPSPTPKHPSPSSSPTSPSDGSTCFPRDARVRLKDGSIVTMSELRVGDIVQDGPRSFSKVILFTHTDAEATTHFLSIKTNLAELVLTPSHYMYINDQLSPASNARVGDEISVISAHGDSRQAKITDINLVVANGLYNPHTISGDIAVFWKGEAVLTSTYTSAVKPKLAHALTLPFRLFENSFGATFPIMSRVFQYGNEFWPSVFRAME